ncbi:hypothetical protein DFH27DRAFT_205423, partial [Peziza echinospora]
CCPPRYPVPQRSVRLLYIPLLFPPSVVSGFPHHQPSTHPDTKVAQLKLKSCRRTTLFSSLPHKSYPSLFFDLFERTKASLFTTIQLEKIRSSSFINSKMQSLSLLLVAVLAVAFSATTVLAVPVPQGATEKWGPESRPAKSNGGGVIVPYESKA